MYNKTTIITILLHSIKHLFIIIAFLLTITPKAIAASELTCGSTTPVEDQLLKLQIENAGLTLKVLQLDEIKTGIKDLLHKKKLQKLKESAQEISLQMEATRDFEGFFKWMSTNLAGYNRYIQAGSYIAVIGKMLPIPYAGQAAVFTKFVAQFTASLNSASVAINTYNNSSHKFINMVNTIDPAKPLDDKKISEAANFANGTFLKDMNDALTKLSMISEYSSGALSFLETLNHYVGETDEYWNKVKGLIRKNVNPKEKSYISESTSNLKTQADIFNKKMKNFEILGKKETNNIKALIVYDELAEEIETYRK